MNFSLKKEIGYFWVWNFAWKTFQLPICSLFFRKMCVAMFWLSL